MSNRKILVTSALPYANGDIHLGHLVEYIQTDIWVRFQKLRGNTCYYMCADDTHGTPIMLSAKKQQISPETLIQKMYEAHTADFKAFDIQFDHYYTTHSSENKALAELIYHKAKAKKAIYDKEIEQYYCDHCQMFLPDRFIRGTCPTCGTENQYGDSCESCSATYLPTQLILPRCAECQTPPVLRKSTHYFFKLSQFEADLKKWLATNPVREEIKNKLNEWFDSGLRDWDISRDAPYFGFKIPDTDDKYFYVWLDAPIGYMATTQHWAESHYTSFDEIWRSGQFEIHHFIGKDILYFHTLFWPAMLMTSGFTLPTQIHIHGFLTVNGQKMSKSRGTFINAKTYLNHLNPEYLRYYYASKLNAAVEDIDLNLDDFVFKINSDVVNKFVNIASRLGSIVNKKLDSQLSVLDENGAKIVMAMRENIDSILELYETLEYNKALKEIIRLAESLNKYIDETAPWALVKENPEQARQVCTAGLNGLRVIAGLLKPVIPKTISGIESFLNTQPFDFENIRSDLTHHKIQVFAHLAERIDKETAELILGV